MTEYETFSRLNYYDIIIDENGKTRLGLKNMELMKKLKLVNYTYWKIKPEFEFRPDLIAEYHYGNANLWWVITTFNNFYKPFEDLYADRKIKIPDENEIHSLLM